MNDNARTILCYGDSNTYGLPPLKILGDFSRYARSVRWTGVLQSRLGEDYVVIEEGLSARTTVHSDAVEGEYKNGLSTLQATLESHMPIDVVVLMLGTNDLKARFNVSAFEISIGMQRLIQTIQRSGSGPDFGAPKILLVSPVPIFERGFLAGMFRGGRNKSLELSEHAAHVAELMGAGFLEAGEYADADTDDGIHLSSESHNSLGMAIANSVDKLINDK